MATDSTNFNVFGYDAVCADNRTDPLPNAEPMRYVLHQRLGLIEVYTRYPIYEVAAPKECCGPESFYNKT